MGVDEKGFGRRKEEYLNLAVFNRHLVWYSCHIHDRVRDLPMYLSLRNKFRL